MDIKCQGNIDYTCKYNYDFKTCACAEPCNGKIDTTCSHGFNFNTCECEAAPALAAVAAPPAQAGSITLKVCSASAILFLNMLD